MATGLYFRGGERKSKRESYRWSLNDDEKPAKPTKGKAKRTYEPGPGRPPEDERQLERWKRCNWLSDNRELNRLYHTAGAQLRRKADRAEDLSEEKFALGSLWPAVEALVIHDWDVPEIAKLFASADKTGRNRTGIAVAERIVPSGLEVLAKFYGLISPSG